MVFVGNPCSRHQPSEVLSSMRRKKQAAIFMRFIALTATTFFIHYSSCRIFPMVEARMPLISPLSVAGASVSASKTITPVTSAFIPSSKIALLEKYQKKYAGVHDIILKIRRGGGVSISEFDEEDEVEEVNDDVEGEKELSNDEYESEEEEEAEEEEEDGTEVSDTDDEEEEEQEDKLPSSSLLKSSVLSKSKENGGLTTSTTTKKTIEYDTILTPPAMQQLFISIGVMLLSNRIDILDAKAVRMARIAFLAYIIVVQLFLLYVRLKAKSINDRTLVMISSPLASLLPAAVTGGVGGEGGNSMVKTLADRVLSTQTTILEYDLKQAKQMNGALLFPMIFNYFLHFKMKQVQPLIMQTATGMVNLAYSPLFQVYVLGRNLERPFKQPANPMMDALRKQEQEQDGEGEGDKSADVEEDVEKEVEDTSDEEGKDDDDDDDEYESSDED